MNVSADTRAGAEEWLPRGQIRSTPFSIIMVLDWLKLFIKTYSETLQNGINSIMNFELAHRELRQTANCRTCSSTVLTWQGSAAIFLFSHFWTRGYAALAAGTTGSNWHKQQQSLFAGYSQDGWIPTSFRTDSRNVNRHQPGLSRSSVCLFLPPLHDVPNTVRIHS